MASGAECQSHGLECESGYRKTVQGAHVDNQNLEQDIQTSDRAMNPQIMSEPQKKFLRGHALIKYSKSEADAYLRETDLAGSALRNAPCARGVPGLDGSNNLNHRFQSLSMKNHDSGIASGHDESESGPAPMSGYLRTGQFAR